MQSMKSGRNYLILEEGAIYPYKLSLRKTDTAIKRIKNSISSITRLMEHLYETDYQLYCLLRNSIFCGVGYLDFDEGRCYRLQEILHEAERLEEQLKKNDDVKVQEELITLELFGYKPFTSSVFLYEKELESSSDKLVTEEIQFVQGKPLRRRRVIHYRETEFGSESTKIDYSAPLRIGKKLGLAALNSYNAWMKNRGR